MTSTGVKRLFALGRAHCVRAGVNCDDTCAGIWPRQRHCGLGAQAWTARRSGSCSTRGPCRASSWLGAAGDAQGQALIREAHKARSKGHRAHVHQRAAACQALCWLEADGRGGPAGSAQEAHALGQDWLCALPA
eukprot:6172774-Pleurochrysis_carterae.AAC.4